MGSLSISLVALDIEKHPPDFVFEQLAEHGAELAVDICYDGDEVVAKAADADVVWLFGGSQILTPDTLERLPNCRVVLRSGAGTDNVAVDAATRLGILVANTPVATVEPVAEHTIALILAVNRQISLHSRLLYEGIWDGLRSKGVGMHLHDKTLGLIGFGRIAREVVRKASGFNLKVLACDPLVDAADMAKMGVQSVTLDELLEQSDYVSLHCPWMDSTQHLIDERRLRQMKDSAVLINTGRGPLVDESALIVALRSGWIGGAGLDVLEQEPPEADNPLLRMDNVVVTPHTASAVEYYPRIFWETAVQTLIEMAQDRLPLWYVNPQAEPRWKVRK